MNNTHWIFTSEDPYLQTLIGAILIFVAVVVFTRVVGLRSFAKFTAYDFVSTVAIGSIISSALTSNTTIAHGAAAIGSLLLLTFILSYLQKKTPIINKFIENSPLLLMDGDTILEENLQHARIEKSQLIAKLREANVLNFDQVQAVVLEATGDISVLHTSDNEIKANFNRDLLAGVRNKP